MSKPNKAKLLRKYKNLSRVLTTNNNMKIVFSGKQAFHIPGLINLPIGDFSDDDFITMSMGFCDHELGHENYTNSDWYHVAGKKSSYLKGLLNALDDFHQERRLIADFRGTRLTLRKLVELCKVKGIFTVLSNEAPIPMFIQAWVLYKARSYLGQPVSDFFNETDKQVLNTFGQQFYTDIHALLSSEVLEGLVSTEHCFNAAESIFQLLIDWIEDNQAEQEDSEGQGDSSNSDAMDDKKFTNEEVEEIIQSLEEYDDDFYDSLISTIEKMAEQHPNGQFIGLPVSKIEISSPISCKRLVDENLRGIISRIKSPLKRVFHDQNYVSNSLHNRGKSISSSRLASVAIGNIKVFDSQSIHRSPNAAIALLIDKSGSMDDEDIKMANSVAYSLSTALDGIEGVESLVAYYPKQFDDIELAVVKAFEEKKSIQSFNIESYGGTPTAEAIQSVTSLLMTRSEPRKLLFVITDGDPNSVSDTETAIEEAQALGVKVFGIGIKQHVRGFTEADFHVIHSTKELVNALTVGLKHAFK
jgi:uncharacterized protein YegL